MNPEYEKIYLEAKKNWDDIAKPIDSLGTLEGDVAKLCAIKGSAEPPVLKKRALLVFGADHGVVKEGVTQTDSSVTRIVMQNFCTGNACTAIMAENANCDVYPVDIGMLQENNNDSDGTKDKTEKNSKEKSSGESENTNSSLKMHQINNRNIRHGTGDIFIEDAMIPEECRRAIEEGMNLVCELKELDYDIVLTGEMGIGNTTPSSALAALLLDKKAEEVTGRGAGLDEAGYKRKIEVVKEIIQRVQKNSSGDDEAFYYLYSAGGLEIAAMTGVFLGAEKYQIPAVADGVISLISAYIAYKLSPESKNYFLASHFPKEKAGQIILSVLDMKPVIDAQLALGEGSGGVMMLPLLDQAISVYQKMGTFEAYDIGKYERFQ